jgi:peptidoglycan L-alanyl-D-glutamate endopeptidase CwlK
MRDKVSIERVKKLHPKIRDEVRSLIEQSEAGFPPNIAIRIVQGLRTFAEQDALYAQGRTDKTKPKVTNSKAGQSYHNFGLAIDFALLIDKDGNGSYETLSWDTLKDFDKDGLPDWKEVVKVFTGAGYEWGGAWSKFKDAPHLEKRFGFHWRQLLDKHNKKMFIEGTEYVRI